MRVFWAMDYGLHDGARGGGVFSTRILVEGLTRRGHYVHAVHPYARRRLPYYPHIVHKGLWFEKRMRKTLRHFHADVVIAQNNVYPYAVRAAKAEGVPVVMVARDTRYRCPQPPAWEGGCMKQCGRCVGLHALLPYPWFRYHLNLSRAMCAASDAQVVPSSYMASDMRTWVQGTDPTVIYPPVDKSHHPEEWDPRDVVFLGRGHYKGADIVAKVAEALPDIPFSIYGNQEPEHLKMFKALPNVTVHGFVRRKEAFRHAKVVLAPSRWYEPAGRNVCEAVHLGVPCVISDRGGVPETAGDGALIVQDPENVDHWASQTHILYHSKSMWSFMSHNGQMRGREMRADRMTSRLEDLLYEVSG
jgi:glycosyltransferase involved in cell wall biosynthesis